MKRTTIIYHDGQVDRRLFDNATHAYHYARSKARSRGTHIRLMSSIDATTPTSHIYKKVTT